MRPVYDIFSVTGDIDVSLEVVPNQIVATVNTSVLYPFDWLLGTDIHIPEIIENVNSIPNISHKTFERWIYDYGLANVQLGQEEWNEDRLMIRVVPVKIALIITHTRQVATRNGHWDNMSVMIMKHRRYLMPLVNASMTGALIGGVLASFCVSAIESDDDNPEPAYRTLLFTLANSIGLQNYYPVGGSKGGAAKIREFNRRTSKYDASRLFFQSDSGISMSISKLDDSQDKNLTIEKFIQKTTSEEEVGKRSRDIRFHGFLPLKLALSELVDRKSAEITHNEMTDEGGSDVEWVKTFFTGRGGFKLGYSFNHWEPQTRRTQSILVGCRSKSRGITNIWTRDQRMKSFIFHEPSGVTSYTTVFGHNKDDMNCVVECVFYHLKHCESIAHFAGLYMSSSEFRFHTWTVTKSRSLLDLNKDFQELAELTRLTIVVVLVDTNVKGVKRLHPDIKAYTRVVSFNMKSGEEAIGSCPLFLLVYKTMYDDTDLTYHCVSLKKLALLEKALCGKCLHWFRYPDSYNYEQSPKGRHSTHFDKCQACKKCGRFTQVGGSHYLSCESFTRANYNSKFQSRLQIEKKLALMTEEQKEEFNKEEQESLYKNQWFADFECFSDASGNHIPYLVVLKEVGEGKEPKVFFGENALRDFIAEILSPHVYGYLWFHNGSGYDFTLLLRGLLTFGGDEFNEELEFLKRGTKILTAKIKSRPRPLVLRDFFLFIAAGLARLCSDFKAPGHATKTTFDHTKIKCFKDAYAHYAEVKSYCVKDVLALEFIVMTFGKALFDISPELISKNISLASQAFAMWKKEEKQEIIESIFIPATMEEYNIYKSMYHGGRVLPTVMRYDTKLWKEGANPYDVDGKIYNPEKHHVESPIEDFNFDDELKMLDVVSLYPNEMARNLFPIGKPQMYEVPTEELQIKEAVDIETAIKQGAHEVIGYDYEEEEEEQLEVVEEDVFMEHPWEKLIKGFKKDNRKVTYTHRLVNESYNKMKALMRRTCYQVDIHPTFPLTVAFLVRKNEYTGSPEQSLAPLTDYWVSGVELLEAIKVGYKLTKVKKMIRWPRVAPIFSNYIKKLFAIKEENKKDKSSSLYIAAKLLMNALSGKFGQKVVTTKTLLTRVLADAEENSVLSSLHSLKIDEVEAVVTKNLQNEDDAAASIPIGYIVTGHKREEDISPTLPIYLSVMILAYSRVRMSRILRSINGYKNPLNCLLYTDTDSMIIRKKAYVELLNVKKGKYVGHGLGQMEDEFPNDHIISARFLAPKTYCLCMLKRVDSKEVVSTQRTSQYYYALKVRCKGIPHRGDVFMPMLEYDANLNNTTDEDNEQKLKILDEKLAKTVEELKDRFYVLRNQVTGERKMMKYLDIEVFTVLMDEPDYVFEVHYGSILRNKNGPLVLTTRWNHRCLNKLSWWKETVTCSRVLLDERGEVTTLCKGYEEKEMPTIADDMDQDDLELALTMEQLQGLDEIDVFDF
jgi:hypothetical protein